ncbi:hypothetical protein C8R44DRAFT_802593 [Mycena epipterygia]|nr:hypothetical protein C8R44DRAFT_802593 [Mycena epipterygia]
MDIDEYDSGVAGESQPSQLLKNVLEPEPEEDISSRNNTIPVDEYDYYKDSSADSVNSHSAPQYHYHGLASTQTQSQQCDDESNPNDEGSQKENAGSSREALSSSGNQVQGVARVQSCGSPEKAPLVDKTRRSPTKVSSIVFILW